MLLATVAPMTDIARLAVDAGYRALGDDAIFGGADVKVIDNIASSVIAADADGNAGAVQLKPSVNIRESDLDDEPEGATLVLKGRTWAVLSSLKLNEFERQLFLRESA